MNSINLNRVVPLSSIISTAFIQIGDTDGIIKLRSHMKSLQISEFTSEVGTDNGTQDISSLSESESSSVVSGSL